MKPIEYVALAMVLVPALAAAAIAAEGVLDKLRTPLEDYGVEDMAYRGMEATATYTVSNPLAGTSPPPWSPSWAPRSPARLTCTCSPAADDPNIHGAPRTILALGEGGAATFTVTWSVGEGAALGTHTLAYKCTCRYLEWQRYKTVTTVKKKVTVTREVNGTTTTTVVTKRLTKTYTRTKTQTATTMLLDTATLTIIPRRVNETLLALELNVTLLQVLVDYPVPGQSSALVNMTVRLYNFGLGLRNSTLPMEQGMLLLHNLTVAVDGVPVIRCGGFCAPAQSLSVTSEPEPSAIGSATLILEPPGRPANSYVFNVTVCYSEDVPEPVRTCISDNITVPLPFGWRLVYHVLDNCQPMQEQWEVVPPNETGYMVVVWDTVGPSVSMRDYCIAAAAGGCEHVLLRVYQDGSMVASRAGRGEAKWCPAEPGTYTAVAVDEYGNTATETYALTWSVGPPPAVKYALLRLALTLMALMAALYIVMGGGWPLRGPWEAG